MQQTLIIWWGGTMIAGIQFHFLQTFHVRTTWSNQFLQRWVDKKICNYIKWFGVIKAFRPNAIQQKWNWLQGSGTKKPKVPYRPVTPRYWIQIWL